VFIDARDDGSGGDNWSYKSCKAPVKSSPPTNQHPTSRMSPLWILLQLRIMEVMVTTGAVRHSKLQSIFTTNKHRPDALPVAQPTGLVG